MKIAKLVAREIYDSRGFPTVECDLFLDNGMHVSASVPSGKSRSSFEACELRDGGTRLMGQGVLKAVDHLENIIAPALVGKEPDMITLDLVLADLDGTENKSRLGANALLAASIAICRAQALMNDMEVYELLAHSFDIESVSMPFPLFNVINGGAHANNGLVIQEFMIMPVGAQSFRGAMEHACMIFHTLGSLLAEHGRSTATGDEGGYASIFTDEQEALDFIMMAIEETGKEFAGDVVLALDIAASQFYNAKTNTYHWREQEMSSDDLIKIYSSFAEHYPIYSIEDGIAQTDTQGWADLMNHFGNGLQIVGDDIFATNANRLVQGITENLVHSAIIKPNQVGTVTETLQAIKLCKANEINTIISHRSGETNDTFIVDLAVGTNSGQIKAGGFSHGERMAKYNRLLKIEDSLMRLILED